MNYTLEIDINKPLVEAIAKFYDPESLPHWQAGFVSATPLEGTSGKTGAKTLLKYKMGKRELEMIETIIKNDLPGNFEASFEAGSVYNLQKNTFEKTCDSSCKWISYNEFHFKGLMKLMGALMPGAFKKQSLKYMKDFKAFVEEGKSVRDKI